MRKMLVILVSLSVMAVSSGCAGLMKARLQSYCDEFDRTGVMPENIYTGKPAYPDIDELKSECAKLRNGTCAGCEDRRVAEPEGSVGFYIETYGLYSKEIDDALRQDEKLKSNIDFCRAAYPAGYTAGIGGLVMAGTGALMLFMNELTRSIGESLAGALNLIGGTAEYVDNTDDAPGIILALSGIVLSVTGFSVVMHAERQKEEIYGKFPLQETGAKSMPGTVLIVKNVGF